MPADGSLHRGDGRAIRWIVGVPLVVLNVVSVVLLYMALTIRPRGEWDDGAYSGIGASCLTALAASALALAISATPSNRHVMGLWWLPPPVTLGVAAVVVWWQRCG